MERRDQVHLQELLDDAVVEPEQCHGMLSRLEQFVEPFAACLVRSKQRMLARQYVAGLASLVKRKNVESIAYHHDQERQMLQKFIGQYTWDHRPLVGELVRQVGAALGRADAVLVIDPSAFAKKGTESVGARAAMVRAAGKGRQLPSGRVLGVCLGGGTGVGRYAVVLAEELGTFESAPHQGRRAGGGEIPHAA